MDAVPKDRACSGPDLNPVGGSVSNDIAFAWGGAADPRVSGIGELKNSKIATSQVGQSVGTYAEIVPRNHRVGVRRAIDRNAATGRYITVSDR